MNMTKTVGMVLGIYGVLAFAVFLFDVTVNLEDGMNTSDAFVDGIKTGVGWPVSLVAAFWK